MQAWGVIMLMLLTSVVTAVSVWLCLSTGCCRCWCCRRDEEVHTQKKRYGTSSTREKKPKVGRPSAAAAPPSFRQQPEEEEEEEEKPKKMKKNKKKEDDLASNQQGKVSSNQQQQCKVCKQQKSQEGLCTNLQCSARQLPKLMSTAAAVAAIDSVTEDPPSIAKKTTSRCKKCGKKSLRQNGTCRMGCNDHEQPNKNQKEEVLSESESSSSP